MFVKPGPRRDAPDRLLVVRAPNGRILSAIGETVPDDDFWHRRLRDGDVVMAEPAPIEPGIRHIGPDGREIVAAQIAAETLAPEAAP